MPLYGIEEEVFLVEPEKPSLQSLYYLTRLMKKEPRFYYFHSASNFARGKDINESLMGGVEIATGIHDNLAGLLANLKVRRKDLIESCEALIVPLGALLNLQSPTNTCAFQVHIGQLDDREKTYQNLAYFLPLLTLLAINAPAAGGKYFGQSYRMLNSFAVGPLTGDPEERFQDIIISRRLGTIELRVFDPIWDLERIRLLLELIEKIAGLDRRCPLELECYNRLRQKVALGGYCPELEPLYRELTEFHDLPKEMLMETSSDRVWRYYQKNGLIKTYAALDNAYRTGDFSSREVPHFKRSWSKIGLGLAGYYLPKLPYIAYKFGREHGYF